MIFGRIFKMDHSIRNLCSQIISSLKGCHISLP